MTSHILLSGIRSFLCQDVNFGPYCLKLTGCPDRLKDCSASPGALWKVAVSHSSGVQSESALKAELAAVVPST